MAWGQGQRRTSTPQHKAWRLAVLRRDRYQCQLRIAGRCIGTATEADHIVPVHLGGTDDLTNGQAACSPCHAKRSSEQGNSAAHQHSRARPPTRHPGLLP